MLHRPGFALLLVLFLGLAAPAHAEDPAPTDKAPEAKPSEAKPAEEPASAKRRPLLWLVEGRPRVFLYGTIHIPDPRVTRHLPVVQAALDQSTALYTELELDMAGQLKMQQAVMKVALLPEDKTLKGLLGEALYARVEKAMPQGMPLAMFAKMKPWLIQFLLIKTLVDEHNKAQAEAAPEEADDENGAPSHAGLGLDPMLYRNAQEAGKQVGGLETIQTQLDVFDSLSFAAQVEMVEGMVDEIEKFRAASEESGDESGDENDDTANEMTRMVEMWLAGDDQGFLRIFEDELKKKGGSEAKKFVEGLLDNRNVNMVKKVRELMKAHPDKTFFVAVGAGHMPGEKGMVKLLEAEGLQVRRLELGDKIPPLPDPEPVKGPAKEPAGAGK